MSLSPTKPRTLSRQPSSPSLAVGLPPPLPDSSVMNPSSPTKHLARRTRIHRGDVESSADSDFSGDEADRSTGWIVPSASAMTLSLSNTPKRKVVGMMDSATVGPARTKKRDTLQARLQQIAVVKKSKSTGDGLSSAGATFLDASLVAARESAFLPAKTVPGANGPSAGATNAGDKVIVCVRIKPTSSAFADTAYHVTPTSLTLSDHHPNVMKRGGKSGREDEYTYTFDKLLQHPATTPQLYAEKIAPLVEKAMNGFNSTVFAYGQTGSGKSFTMTGISSELGIIPCAVDGVFDAINADTERAFLLRVSYIEIYNETLRDLLNLKKGPLKDEDKPAIHFNKGRVWVDPLMEEIVSTPQDVVDLLEKGNAGRRIGATDWNDRSSRSHCVFTIVIESRPRDGDGEDDIRLSRLNLIDLAGSEKAVTDLERRGEGKHINQSLLALREVINKLTEKKRSHIPYRNSKLTHLLENALGGDSNICVICTLSAEEEHCAETLETLKFAGRCSQVETKARKNVLQSSERALILAKDQEIEELKRRLHSIETPVKFTASSVIVTAESTELADSVAGLEARKKALTVQLAKLNGEILISELPRSASGFPMSPPRQKRRRISDFATLVGIGSPKAKVVADRRAISGMTRLSEEGQVLGLDGALDWSDDPSKAFDHDRTIASLRRALVDREEQLSSAKSELAIISTQAAIVGTQDIEITELRGAVLSLQAAAKEAAEQHDVASRDVHVQLESTRAELVLTIEDKTRKIDTLEMTVLELRKSREDLAIEDQQRMDSLQANLEERLKRMAEELDLSRTAQVEADRQRSEAVVQLERYQQDGMTSASDTAAGLRADLAKACEAAEVARGEKALVLKLLSEDRLAREELRSAMEIERRRAEQADKAVERLKAASIGNDAASQQLRMEMEEMRRGREEERRRREELAELLRLEKGKREEDERQRDELRKLLEEENGKGKEEQGKRRKLEMLLEQEKGKTDQTERRLGEAVTLGMKQEEMRKNGEEQVKALQVALAEAKDEVSEANRRATSLDASANELRGEFERFKASAAPLPTINDLKCAISEARLKLSEGEVLLLEREKKVSALSREVEALKVENIALPALRHQVQELEERTITTANALQQQVRELEEGSINAVNTIDSLRSKEEEQVRKVAELEKEVARRLAELMEAAKRTGELEDEVEKMKIEKARLPSEDTVEGLKNALSAAEARAAAAESSLTASRREVGLLHSEVEGFKFDANTQRDEVQRLEAARAALLSSQDIHDLRFSLQSTADRLVEAERATVESEATAATLRKENEDLESRATAQHKENEALKSTTATLYQENEGLKSTATTVSNELEALKATAARLPTVDEVRRLTQKLDEARRTAVEARQVREDAQRIAERMEAEVKRLLAELNGRPTGRVVDDLRAELSSARSAEQVLKRKLDEATHLVDVMEKDVVRLQAIQAGLPSATAMKDLEIALDATRKALEANKKEVADLSDRNAGLAKDLGGTRAQLTAISKATGDMDRLRVRDKEEIARLEKVLEEQREMIDEQREKIKFWAEELQRQHEVIKTLTAELNATNANSNANGGSPGSRHTKSKSLALPSPAGGFDSPSQPSSHFGYGIKTRSHLSSTFTAHNLALPSTPRTLQGSDLDATPQGCPVAPFMTGLTQPIPLPSHPSQWSNSSSKRARRITIEHDIDLLAESSRVLQAKRIFDSPRTASASLDSVPKKRRA